MSFIETVSLVVQINRVVAVRLHPLFDGLHTGVVATLQPVLIVMSPFECEYIAKVVFRCGWCLFGLVIGRLIVIRCIKFLAIGILLVIPLLDLVKRTDSGQPILLSCVLAIHLVCCPVLISILASAEAKLTRIHRQEPAVVRLTCQLPISLLLFS